MKNKEPIIIPETGFFFDKENHRYYLNGKQMTGVTTILSVIAKPQLIQWAANETIKYIENNCPHPVGQDYQVSVVALEKARTAHAQKRDKSADIGTMVHRALELWIKGNPKSQCFEHIPEGQIGMAEKMFDNFVSWAEENKVNFLASEKIVYSEKYFYGGTLDFIAEINGKIFLGDIKTSSGIYPEMFYQTAAYQNALYECEPSAQLIEGHIIVNCTKDGRLNIKQTDEYEANRQAFMGALALYRRSLQIK